MVRERTNPHIPAGPIASRPVVLRCSGSRSRVTDFPKCIGGASPAWPFGNWQEALGVGVRHRPHTAAVIGLYVLSSVTTMFLVVIQAMVAWKEDPGR